MAGSTFLYVPADRADRFSNALSSGARAVIFDLEDSVAPDRKASALDNVAAHLETASRGPIEQWVRVNSIGEQNRECAVLAGLAGLTGFVVPKATSVTARACTIATIALIESADALWSLLDIARSPMVRALALGEVDLTGQLGIEPSQDEHELWPFRMQVVSASGAAKLEAPLGPVHTLIGDDDGLRHSSALLRRAGFGSRQAIHPRQVPIIDAAMAPSGADLDRAEMILQLAAAAGGAACADDQGRLIDAATLVWARRIVADKSTASHT